MGQVLTYRAGEQSFAWKLLKADWDAVQSLRVHLPAEVALLFETAALGEIEEVSTSNARDALRRVETFLSDHPECLPARYEFKIGKPPHPLMRSEFMDGGMSGIHMPGDQKHYFLISAGVNECFLERWGESGPIDRRDLRATSEIETADCGIISIRRVSLKSGVAEQLKKLGAFFDAAGGGSVSKSIE